MTSYIPSNDALRRRKLAFTLDLNVLQTKINTNYIYILRPYRAVNILCLSMIHIGALRNTEAYVIKTTNAQYKMVYTVLLLSTRLIQPAPVAARSKA